MGSKWYALGLDLGGTNFRVGVVDSAGVVVSKSSLPSGPGTLGLDRALNLAQDILKTPGIETQEVLGVGIGVAGIVDASHGIVLHAPALAWHDFSLADHFHTALGLPVWLENDVRVALIGEAWLGAARKNNDVVMVSVGTGIGGAIMVEGKLRRGSTGAAGEVGFLIVDPTCLGRRFAERGCLETLASGPAIVNRASQAGFRPESTSKGDSSTEGVPQLTAERVCEAARRGDRIAARVVEETATYLGLAIANISCVLNPEVVILGGGVARSHDLLLPTIRRIVRDALPVAPAIACGELADLAGVIGAARLVFQRGQVGNDFAIHGVWWASG